MANITRDPVQLERALRNLIRNGIEAIQGDSTSSKRQVRVSVTNEADGPVEVHVEDTGPGLPADIEPLFKPTKSNKAHGLVSDSISLEKLCAGMVAISALGTRKTWV